MSSDQPTARGDRAQRRIDVVTAAVAILEESGWAGLNMREVARRAGVSAGALYQWFAGKDEIYAELYTSRLTEGAAGLQDLPHDITPEQVIRAMFIWVGKTWSDLGRWQLEFAEISRTRDDTAPVVALAEAHRRLLEVGMQVLEASATTHGITIHVNDETAHLLWATATGVAMRCEVLSFDDATTRSLTNDAVAMVLAGLTESA